MGLESMGRGALWCWDHQRKGWTVMEKVRAFLEAYRVWPEADTELERELTALVDEHEQMTEFEEAVAREHRLHEGPDTLSDQQAIERAVERYATIRDVLEDQMVVDVDGTDDLKGHLLAYVKRRDELEVFRNLILGAVKKTGALAMDAFPEDNMLVTLVGVLFP